jgi:hypothetical protein
VDTSRYEAAVDRNLAELQRAIINRRAMVANGQEIPGQSDTVIPE